MITTNKSIPITTPPPATAASWTTGTSPIFLPSVASVADIVFCVGSPVLKHSSSDSEIDNNNNNYYSNMYLTKLTLIIRIIIYYRFFHVRVDNSCMGP